MKKLFICLIILTLLPSCRGKIFSSDNIFAPRPPTMGKRPDDAPDLYKRGWDDGCETGLSTMNHGYYKSFYSYKQDFELAKNAMYYKAWKDAYTYCRQYTFRFVWKPFDDSAENYKNLCILCDPTDKDARN